MEINSPRRVDGSALGEDVRSRQQHSGTRSQDPPERIPRVRRSQRSGVERLGVGDLEAQSEPYK